MSISIRDLFGRQGIVGEIISVRNSLSNHPEGTNIGLREAHRRLLEPADGNGLVRGCLPPGFVEIDYWIGKKEAWKVLPQWAPVAGTTGLDHDQVSGETFLRPDFVGETRTLEGILVRSHVATEDFPFQPWHTYYDWNFHIRVDNQYTYLNSPSNIQDEDGLIECEWDTAFLPDWAWPFEGNRIWMVGRWIYDCGHPSDHGHRSEIHPPKAIASFRSEAVQFEGNAGPTRANVALLFIGRDGGYWRQPINDQNYAFDLYLPPKPHPESIPRYRIEPQTEAFPVQPQVIPFPANNPRALRVVIPLKGVEPHPENYGAIISGGWSDPHGTESAASKWFRVTVEKIYMDADLDPANPLDWSGKDEWYVYVGINGRWHIWKSLHGASHDLNYSVELALHPSDQIHITGCGFEADETHDLMGHNSGLSWAQISDRARAVDNAEIIKDGFFSLGASLDAGIENEGVSYFSQFHPPAALDAVTIVSTGNDYRLRYRIEEI